MVPKPAPDRRSAGQVRHVALLRGINVGGHNLIRMADLRNCFEAAGFADVATYIQSGNVSFSAAEIRGPALERQLERLLSERFGYAASVVVRTRDELAAVVARAPAGFGAEPDRHRYDVLFLKAPLTAALAMQSVSARAGVDRAHAGDGVLYFSRLASRAAQSHLTRLISQPIYKSLTIRNWNTTTKLLALLDA
ncbi:MAG: DUF1697 domain-containing protein [Vicinamibacteria bacterium]|nr:DUF1697 domain-containing protein [Vicinamibacteria bacterium]